jgi:hypothetical protein
MPRRYFVSSTSRRHRQADRIQAAGFLAMRPCSHCVAAHHFCVLSELSEKCEQCHRFGRPYDLAPPWSEVDRLLEKRDKLHEQAREAEVKALRLRKQARALLKKARALGDRESKNIEEIEADEALADLPVLEPSQASIPRPRSPSGFFQVSFGSLGRTSLVPTGSS